MSQGYAYPLKIITLILFVIPHSPYSMSVLVTRFPFEHIATAVFDLEEIPVLNILCVNKTKVLGGPD